MSDSTSEAKPFLGNLTRARIVAAWPTFRAESVRIYPRELFRKRYRPSHDICTTWQASAVGPSITPMSGSSWRRIIEAHSVSLPRSQRATEVLFQDRAMITDVFGPLVRGRWRQTTACRLRGYDSR